MKELGPQIGTQHVPPLNLPMYIDGDLVLNKGYEPQFSTKMMNSISTVPSCAAHRFKRTTLNQYYFETNWTKILFLTLGKIYKWIKSKCR